MEWDGGNDTVLQDVGVPLSTGDSDGVIACPNLKAMGATPWQGQRHTGGPNTWVPPCWVRGTGTMTLYLPHGPTPDTPIPAVGQLRALPPNP